MERASKKGRDEKACVWQVHENASWLLTRGTEQSEGLALLMQWMTVLHYMAGTCMDFTSIDFQNHNYSSACVGKQPMWGDEKNHWKEKKKICWRFWACRQYSRIWAENMFYLFIYLWRTIHFIWWPSSFFSSLFILILPVLFSLVYSGIYTTNWKSGCSMWKTKSLYLSLSLPLSLSPPLPPPTLSLSVCVCVCERESEIGGGEKVCKRKRALKECTNSTKMCLFVSIMDKIYLLFKVNDITYYLLLHCIYFSLIWNGNISPVIPIVSNPSASVLIRQRKILVINWHVNGVISVQVFPSFCDANSGARDSDWRVGALWRGDGCALFFQSSPNTSDLSALKSYYLKH